MPKEPQTTLEEQEKARLERLRYYSDEELLEEIKTRFMMYSGMEHRFSCVLDHATGGMMSKTCYTKEAMYQQVDEFVQRQVDEELQDIKEENDIINQEDIDAFKTDHPTGG